MLNRLLNQTREPKGFLGKIMLYGMNKGHSPITAWGLSFLKIKEKMHILDVGCGGGATIIKMLQTFPDSMVDGIDYSEESVAFTKKKIEKFKNRSRIQQGDVKNMPYSNQTYDLITAFETIYFWNDLKKAFLEIRRILKYGGTFFICCESGDSKDTTWTKRIEGMIVYEEQEIRKYLEEAGFQKIEVHTNQRGWMCVVAE